MEKKEIQNRIDKAWDSCWTGGLVVPTTVVEQLTYLLFIKMLDEREDINNKNIAMLSQIYKNDPSKIEELKKNSIFPEGKEFEVDGRKIPYADMRWQNFKDFNAERMFAVVRDFVFPFIVSLNDSSDKTKKVTAYSKFMKNALFMIPTPRVLDDIVKQFKDINLSDKDLMGDVYEYILGKMAASGTNGQFRTPRHIINMMVALMEPKVTDTICDPAMGTAGFLVGCAEYCNDNYKTELMDKTNQNHYNSYMFNGFDMDQTMLRLGAMNMILHGVKEPQIEYRDSLSKDNTDVEKYDLIMANPPFKGKMYYEGVSEDLLTITKATKTELLFLALFVRSLKIGGRCCCIVPDGVLFGSSNQHLSIRKEIIDSQQLEAVISMPSGVFKPYAGVSTAILVFTKTGKPGKEVGGTTNVFFYDMTSDGLSLDDKRQQLKNPDGTDSQGDIPDIIASFKDRKNNNNPRTAKCFNVPVSDIRANNYDLSINKYKETVKEEKVYRSSTEITNDIIANQIEILKGINDLEEKLGLSVTDWKKKLGE